MYEQNRCQKKGDPPGRDPTEIPRVMRYWNTAGRWLRPKGHKLPHPAAIIDPRVNVFPFSSESMKVQSRESGFLAPFGVTDGPGNG